VREKQHFVALKLDDPWARLAAAYHLIGDPQALERLLKHHPAAGLGVADMHAAAQNWKQAVAEYHQLLKHSPADAASLTKLAAAYQGGGRTRDALPHLEKAWAASPKDTLLSQRIAALHAWFAQHKEFADTRKRILALAKDTSDSAAAERAVKAYCIRPAAGKAELAQALTLARTAVKIRKGGSFNLLALGMAEYRSGNDAAAMKALLAAEKAAPNNPHVTGIAVFFRAMSLFRQGKHDEARKLALVAAAKMKPPPTDENNPLAGNATPDDMILWLAHREAKALIQFDAVPLPRSKKQ
jgi:tetratricopeptide (TPR) repeat protein